MTRVNRVQAFDVMRTSQTAVIRYVADSCVVGPVHGQLLNQMWAAGCQMQEPLRQSAEIRGPGIDIAGRPLVSQTCRGTPRRGCDGLAERFRAKDRGHPAWMRVPSYPCGERRSRCREWLARRSLPTSLREERRRRPWSQAPALPPGPDRYYALPSSCLEDG